MYRCLFEVSVSMVFEEVHNFRLEAPLPISRLISVIGRLLGNMYRGSSVG